MTRIKRIISFPLQRRAVIIHRRSGRRVRLGFVVTHFHVRVFGGRGVGLGPGVCPFLRLALLALSVLGCCFVEEGFAVALHGLLVFLTDFGRVIHAVLLVVALDEFFGRLLMLDAGPGLCAERTYLSGEPLEMVLGNLVLVLVDDVLDMWMELLWSA